LCKEQNKKREEDTTLRQQMLLLKHFNLIDIIIMMPKTIDKKAYVLSKILNADKNNIKGYLKTIVYLKNSIHAPSEYRNDPKLRTKTHKKFNIYTKENLDYLNKVLSKLKMDNV
jgi:hypothetical protein